MPVYIYIDRAGDGVLPGCNSHSVHPYPPILACAVYAGPGLDGAGLQPVHSPGPPGYALAVFERPASALDLTQAEITLRWGAPAETSGSLVELGADDLALVVNPHNPLQSLTASQVRDIFSGANHAWSDYSKASPDSIQVWSYPQGNEIRQYFEDALPAPDLLPSAHLAPDPKALRQAVAADPSAIGFLPGRWVDSSVRPLSIAWYFRNRPAPADPGHYSVSTPRGAEGMAVVSATFNRPKVSYT